LLLIGHSAGGHLALWLAAQSAAIHLQSVLALAPAVDLQMAHAMNLGMVQFIVFWAKFH
jgi:acetyl esterase/lipase